MRGRFGWTLLVVMLCACHHAAPSIADAPGSDAAIACTNPQADCPAPPACQAAACAADQTCTTQPDPAQNGASCGSGMVCQTGACVAMSGTCGDGVVQAGEQCDFGSGNGSGTGCEANCMFSCTMSPNSCDDGNPCNGAEACNAVTVNGATGQACAAGTPLADGASCGSGEICVAKACVAARCGDGIVTPPEQCDDGDANGTPGDGCTASCAYACVNASTDCGAEPACQLWSCSATHACEAMPDPTQNGMSCGTGKVCTNGTCAAPTCGNGVIDPGEQCDDGAANGTPGDGCTSTCTYVCSNPATDCGTAPACETYTCTATHTCQAVADPTLNGTSCGTGMVCEAGACVTPAVGCGNGIREAGEQCDDGNTTNLDGCDASCKFEQVQRIDDMAMSFSTTAYCPKNALGTAIVGSTAQGDLDSAIQTGLADGSITVQFLAVGLDDLTGTSDASVGLGLIGGSPQTGSTTYNGWTGTMGSPGYTTTPDLDWWFTTDTTTIDPTTRTPNVTLNGSIAAHLVDVGPAAFSFTASFAGVPVTMNMVGATIQATTGASSTPLTSSGTTPGHLASEHLDPTLQSFATMTGGQLCGKTLASSLYGTTVPTALTGCGGLTNCQQCYTSANSLLDVMVSGCTAAFGFSPQIKAIQPDTSANGTDTYTFTVNASTHQVNGCKKNGVTDTLADCVANAAFTTLYTFSADRVIAK